MNEEAFTFQKLIVRRMPGFPSGGWELRDLSPGVNVISGPNGCGKSTTMRGIETIIWPGELASRQTQLAADFALRGEPWHAEIDGAHWQFQRVGVPADPPGLPLASAVRSRYGLTLPDLLATGDKDFAQAIVREAAGGFDVPQAMVALGFSTAIPRSRRLWQDYNAACDAVRWTVEVQRNATGEQAELAELERSLAGAKQANSDAEKIRLAIDKRRHIQQFDQAELVCGEFDKRLERINGLECDQLAEKLKTLQDVRANLAAERDSIQTATVEIASCNLPSEGVATGVIETLRQEVHQLLTGEQEARRVATELAQARARMEDAERIIGDTVDQARLARIDAGRLNEFADFSSRFEQYQGHQSAHDALCAWLGETNPSPDLYSLAELEFALGAWLRAPNGVAMLPQWLRPLLFGVAALTALGSVAVGVSGTPSAFAGLIIAVLVLVAVLSLRETVCVPPMPHVPAGLTPPASWDVEGVHQRLTEIRREIADAQINEEKRQRWAHIKPYGQQLAATAVDLEREAADINERFGWSLQGRTFHVVANAVHAWQEAQRDLLAREAGLKEQNEQYTSILARINGCLAAFDYLESATAAEANGRLLNLVERVERWRLSQANRSGAERMIQQIETQRDELEGEIAGIFEATGAADEHELRLLCDRLPDFKIARHTLYGASGLRAEALAFFAENPELESRSTDQLESDLRNADTRAADVAKHARRIGEIERVIDAVKIGDALQRALSERERARGDLVEERERGLASLAGYLIAEHVREESRSRAMPEVFHRASELFTQITAGASRLVPVDLTNAEFRAVDTATGEGRGLDELSGGTRVQLLLAVRVAFVEKREDGASLPLLLDETFANSDDERFRKIIEAVAALARGGRQIFYFTAQWDEVVKWREFFEHDSNVLNRFIDMREARGLAAPPPFERLSTPVPPPVLEAGDMSYEEYGRRLGVLGFDPAVETLGSLHVWHLSEDVQTVHRLLSLGFESWGQIEECLRLGHAVLDDGANSRLQANAQLHEELGRCWRHGRARPVNRDTLVDGGVSDNFLETVWSLACECGRDAQKLLKLLDDGVVARFRRQSMENLRAHLDENGFLSHDTPLTRAAIRRRLLPLAQEHGIDEARLDSVLQKICVPTP